MFVVVFQSTQGSAFWVYVAEIASDTALGITLLVLMGVLTIQSLFSLQIINSSLGIDGFFYVLAGFQLFTCVVLSIWMKETKGLSQEEKQNLYRIKLFDLHAEK